MTTAAAAAAVSASQILHQTCTFLSEAISQPDFRHHLFTTLRNKTKKTTSLKPLNLALQTLEKAISATNPSTQSSSLRLAERLLVSYPETPLSSFLLSLISTLTQQHTNASISLLNIFYLDPLLARSDIAPFIFQDLFLVHLLPVLEWFNERRSRISSSFSTNMGYDSDENSTCDVSVVLPSSKLLSKISGGQALELKELERSYEDVIDENCRVFAQYFMEILKNSDANIAITPPSFILKGKADKLSGGDDKRIKTEELGFENGRYNPIWADGERSDEFFTFSGSRNSRSKSSPSSYPRRVSAKTQKIENHRTLSTSPTLVSDSELESSLGDNMLNSSSESGAELEIKNEKLKLFEPRQSQSQTQKQKQLNIADSSSPTDHVMGDKDNPPGAGKHTPPKDFVCPITSHLFDDPVTLETGQTYERRAIQEWIERGNSTCPITRQELHSTQLPKTNYVLKRLVASWIELNPEFVSNHAETQQQKTESSFKPTGRAPNFSPNSVISQASIDSTMSELRQAITNLCMSEILNESEMAVLQIEQFWQDANMDLDIQSMLSKPSVINGFVEILFNSVDPQVLRATVFLLSELGSREKSVVQTLKRVESDVECIVALFKKGLLEAVVLIYLLTPSTMRLLEMDMVESLLTVITKKDDDMLKMCMKPKTAAVLLLGQILGSSEESIVSSIANAIVSTKVIESIVECLEAEWVVERISAVGILTRCMQEYGKCRNMIADKAELAPVLDSFMSASDGQRFEIVRFFFELVKLNRRTFSEQVLHIIKDEGPFSTMHSLLNYLQTALQDQCPVVAGLLLQLDLLAEPKKMSIYREEAIDVLISCLRKSEFPAAQIAAADTIILLQGRFTASGKSLTRALLLKRAGLGKSYRNLMRMEQRGNLSVEIEEISEEERAAEDWERKMAFALVSHEFGLVFEALAEGLKSRNADFRAACFVSATWLTHMLGVLPDTGIRGAARVCLLKRFITIFKSTKDTEDRVLSLLALKSFISDPEGLRDLTSYMKDIKKGLRELKKFSPLALEILNVLSEGRDSSAELWNHEELAQADCSENGEVLSVACFKNIIFSGHSDGTIKVWTGRGSVLHLIQETKEHTKAVTSLVLLQSGERLYSGSLDRTARVWSISNEDLHCVQMHDMKDQVHNLVVANSISCFIPQGAGVKVHSWNGGSKLLNPNKYVKCLTLVQGQLYCGCHDNSIQEIDLATGTLVTIQHGSRKLLGKSNPIHALQVRNGLIYAASSALDGAAVKIWNASNYGQVGSVPTTLEVRAMVISSELIYLGSKGGSIEIWDQKKQNRIETLQIGRDGARILCMALDDNEEMLVIGTSDGRIQAWGLS